MGYAMAERLAKGGCDIAVWNRTKAKADPLSKYGAKVVNQLEELSTKDILFVMVSTFDDVKEVLAKALAKGKPKMVVQTAVKNKIISRVFATVKRGTPFVPLFTFAQP